eukprot:758573-Hanusia_phi.AAC.6
MMTPIGPGPDAVENVEGLATRSLRPGRGCSPARYAGQTQPPCHCSNRLDSAVMVTQWRPPPVPFGRAGADRRARAAWAPPV